MLSNPYERFPSTFGKFEFWKTYPYALPCFVVAIYCGFSFILTYIFLEEVCTLFKVLTADLDVIDCQIPNIEFGPSTAGTTFR